MLAVDGHRRAVIARSEGLAAARKSDKCSMKKVSTRPHRRRLEWDIFVKVDKTKASFTFFDLLLTFKPRPIACKLRECFLHQLQFFIRVGLSKGRLDGLNSPTLRVEIGHR
jgi:hypothetical protein